MDDFSGDGRLPASQGEGNAGMHGGIKRELPRGGVDFKRNLLAGAHFQVSFTTSPS